MRRIRNVKPGGELKLLLVRRQRRPRGPGGLPEATPGGALRGALRRAARRLVGRPLPRGLAARRKPPRCLARPAPGRREHRQGSVPSGRRAGKMPALPACTASRGPGLRRQAGGRICDSRKRASAHNRPRGRRASRRRSVGTFHTKRRRATRESPLKGTVERSVYCFRDASSISR